MPLQDLKFKTSDSEDKNKHQKFVWRERCLRGFEPVKSITCKTGCLWKHFPPEGSVNAPKLLAVQEHAP